MKLEPNEAIALIIHRNEANPPKYVVTVRKSEGYFTPSNDFCFQSAQLSVLNLQQEEDPLEALEHAFTAIMDFVPE